MALDMSLDCVDVYLPDKLVIVDVCTYRLVPRKYCTVYATVPIDSSVGANTVKDAAFTSSISINCNVTAHHNGSAKFNVAISIFANVHPYAINESTVVTSLVELHSKVDVTGLRKRMLSDLDSVTLADINDLTLQELYWVET